MAKPLGAVLTEISCEVIEQLFGEMSRSKHALDNESEKTIQQVTDTMQKYMPWSVSFFGNERLTPMVNYLAEMMDQQAGQAVLTYPVDSILIKETLGNIEQIKQGNSAYIDPAFKGFVQIIDQGVSCLIRDPKKMLKFNLVVDKTLNGVIQLTTQLGYKRLEKMGKQFDLESAEIYLNHFLGFLQHPAQLKA
nr:hypothetical protein [Acinetobacter sp. A1]